MKKSKTGKFFILFGMVFILLALGLLIYNLVSVHQAKQYNEEICRQILSSVPEQSDVIFDENSHRNMPVMEIENRDYIGLIEVPRYEIKLPVLSERQKESRKASPYKNNISDTENSSLIISGSGRDGQFDFLSWIETDDTIVFSDMNGYRCSFIVEEIEKADKLNFESLVSDNNYLILTAKETWGFDYLIVRCRAFDA